MLSEKKRKWAVILHGIYIIGLHNNKLIYSISYWIAYFFMENVQEIVNCDEDSGLFLRVNKPFFILFFSNKENYVIVGQIYPIWSNNRL